MNSAEFVWTNTVSSLLCNINTLLTEPTGCTLQTNGVNCLQH